MNRRVKHPKLNQNTAGQIQLLDTDYSWKTLTANQKRKCRQKFDAYKPQSSQKISKYQLQRMLRQMGKQITQQEILQKMWEADPKGEGFVSYPAFMKVIQQQKEKKFQEVTNFIGLTFDQVLFQQRQKLRDSTIQQVTWEFLKIYFSQNFQIQINVNILAGKRSLNKSLNRNQFMSIFS